MSEELKKLQDAFDAWMACDEGAELTSADYPVLEALLGAIPAALGRRGAQEAPKDCCDFCYEEGYRAGLADQSGSGVLQAVLDAIKGTLDPHSQIADHPNVKFAQMQMSALRGVGVEAGAHGGTPKAKDDDQCGAPENPAGFSYECTLPKGHDGPHVAHGANWQELHRWAQPVPLGTPQKKETVTTGFSSRTMASGAMCAPSGAPDWMATSASSALPESTDEARNRVEPSGEDSVPSVPLGTLHQGREGPMTETDLDLLIAMAKDWTDPAVVRDAPERVPHVIEQLIAAIQELRVAAFPSSPAEKET